MYVCHKANKRSIYLSIYLSIYPLVPGMQNKKIRQFITGWLLIVGFVKKLVCLDAHYYSERSRTNGLNQIINFLVIHGIKKNYN